MIHCKNGISYVNISESTWNFDYWLILRQLINFTVPVFIFISGYFTNIEKMKCYNSYLLQRMRRLLIPFWIWSAFYTIINIISSSGDINLIKICIKFLLGLSSGPLYFILVLVQLTILTPILVKFILNNKYIKMSLLITPAYLIFLYMYQIICKEQLPFYQTVFPAWFIFYYVGLYIKINGRNILFKNITITKSVIFCVVTLGVSIIEAYVIYKFNLSVGFAVSQIKISSFLYSLAIINLIFILKPYINMKINILKVIGDNSYGIYYIHMWWIIVSNKILPIINSIKYILPIYQIIQLVIVVAMSIITIILIKKIVGNKLSRKLGF